MSPTDFPVSPLEDWSDTPLAQGGRLLIKRDDLLPFPLAGNKVRKLSSELRSVDAGTTTLVTVGAITSNHCRTTAIFAARRGFSAHLLLHGNQETPGAKLALALLKQLGASWEIVEPNEIAIKVEALVARGTPSLHFISGGCHTVAGVQAYMEAVEELATQLAEQPDYIVVASGTGATQAGLIAGLRRVGWHRSRVLGVSVARTKERGTQAIEEALSWVNCTDIEIDFTDAYRAGGYGCYNAQTLEIVEDAWRAGLPADTTYTGKALHALRDLRAAGEISGTVVFWHTGGLATHLFSLAEKPSRKD